MRRVKIITVVQHCERLKRIIKFVFEKKFCVVFSATFSYVALNNVGFFLIEEKVIDCLVYGECRVTVSRACH